MVRREATNRLAGHVAPPTDLKFQGRVRWNGSKGLFGPRRSAQGPGPTKEHDTKVTTNTTPYERIGGDRAVAEIVADFYQRVITDRELAPFFAKTDLERLLAMQHEYVTVALGGPGTSSPSGLRDAHAGRGISGHHFERFLDLFLETIRERGLSENELDRVLDRLAIASTDVLDSYTEDG